MKNYSREEKNGAKEKLPRPIFDYMGSSALTNVYIGIKDKLKLDLRQLMLMAEVANITLMGLEKESALEANLHQELPELSNEKTRELVGDINDRVFKEARRRLVENIVEPEEPWDEATFGPREAFKRPPNSVELAALIEEEERTGKKFEGTKVDTGSLPTDTSPLQISQESQTVTASVDPTPSATREKLETQRVVKPEEVSIAPVVQKPQDMESAGPRKADVYREPVE